MIDRRAFLAGVSLGLVARGTARGSEESRASLERALKELRRKHGLPGVAGALVRGEAVETIAAVGVRKVGSTEPLKATDQFHLGSDTKAMTATMIGTVVDEGKLGWESTVGEVCKAEASRLHPDFRKVTLWQLLTHRAGVRANLKPGDYDPTASTTAQRRGVLLAAMKDAPLSPPGTKYAYANIGYMIAGLLAERATGKSWEVLMGERLFRPLGMEGAGFGPPGLKGKVVQPWGHKKAGEKYEPVFLDNPPVLGPAGTVHCRFSAWAKFATLHMRAAEGKPKLLKAETFGKLHEAPKGFDYAGGWIVTSRDWAGGKAFTHSGSNTFWYATVWLAPKHDFALLAATNAGGGDADEATDEIIGALIDVEKASRPKGA